MNHSGKVGIRVWGVAILAVCAVCGHAQTFTVLHSFQAGLDGDGPWGGVALDRQGNLYGTTWAAGRYRNGVVYKINVSGEEKVLHAFEYHQGSQPFDTPYVDANGNVYGTTEDGASAGTVFELFKGGRLKVLHQFLHDMPGDGYHPQTPVVQDAAGNLYGTTPYGTAGFGTVYKIDASGVETILYNFAGAPDGNSPAAGVILDPAGNVYGTTILGGEYGFDGFGTVFKVDASGQETVLHSFSGDDGEQPTAGLVRDEAGNLYGTTYEGGAYHGGVVFNISPDNTFTVLHNFGEFSGDGSLPYAGVIRDTAGNLYGTSSAGGSYFAGAVYKLDPSGNVTILHSFTGGADGSFPYAGVTLDPAGNLYGTTVYGGDYGFGVVYKITP
jgi:uncharacterized repeat protein (TIGR03803 family)